MGLGVPGRRFGPYGRPDANAPAEIKPKSEVPANDIPSVEEPEQINEEPTDQESL